MEKQLKTTTGLCLVQESRYEYLFFRTCDWNKEQSENWNIDSM